MFYDMNHIYVPTSQIPGPISNCSKEQKRRRATAYIDQHSSRVKSYSRTAYLHYDTYTWKNVEAGGGGEPDWRPEGPKNVEKNGVASE